MIDNLYDITGAKGGEQKPHTPVETPNNLLSVAIAKVLIAVAEGELAGNPTARDIYLDGTPLQNADGSMNFGGVKWEWRSGSQDQTYISGIPEVSTEYGINVELTDQVVWTRQVTKSQLDALRVTFQWPALMQQQSNGDTTGYAMKYAIDLQVDGGAWTTYQEYTIDGKTNSSYERTHRVELPKATFWTIRARRVTPENNSGMVQDTIFVKSYAEVVDVKQRYPNTALLYVEFDSRLFGTGNIPKVSVDTRGRVIRVPSNYDADNRSYTGVWDGSFKWSWTDNPAWIYYDLVTQDRFGLGNKVTPAMVDKFALYEIAKYCDQMVPDGTGVQGAVEPRHTCNIYIQEKADAWKVLRDIASIFNGMTYWDGRQFVASADRRENLTNLPIFSRSNVIGGRFEYGATDDKSIYTSALVSYDDPQTHYSTQVEASFETSQILRWGGDRQIELSAIGCTSRGQAQRKGKYTLLTNMFNRTVSFQTGLQGLDYDVLPGKLIQVTDPLIGGRAFTGRIKAGTATVITLDRETEAKPGDILYVTKKNGQSEGRTVIASSKNVITVSAPYSEIPVASAVWYLEASDLKSQLYRVTKISSPSESIYTIEGVEYNDSKYDAVDTGARLEDRPISVVPSNLQKSPENIRLLTSTYVEQTMAVTKLSIVWDQTPGAVFYEVQWKKDDGDWVNGGVTGATQIDIVGVYTGNYVARVRAINAIGIKSVWATSLGTQIIGKEGAPPALASLTTTPMLFGIRLDWAFKPGSTDTLYTQIRYGATADFSLSTALGDFSYPTDSHEMHGLKAGQAFWFWARLQDRTGNYGDWYPVNTGAGIRGNSLDNTDGAYNDYFAGLISETALDKELYDRIELIDGPATLPGSVNERIKTVNDKVDLTNEKLDDAIDELNDKINNINDALVYDPTKSYEKWDVVRFGQKLYQAIKPVPVGVSPPDPEYWEDIGKVLEENGALVSQVEQNTQDIVELDGKITASASQLESITAQWREDDGEGDLNDAITGWNSRAQIAEERQVRASADEAFAQRLIVISSEIGDNKAAISTLERTTATADQALSERIDSVSATTKTETDRLQAAITSEQTARTTADEALGKRVDVVGAAIVTETTNRDAAIKTEQTARVNADEALGTRITTTQATQDLENKRLDAAIKTEETARTTADTALGKRVDTVSASIASEGTRLDAAIRTEQTARTDADGALGVRIDQVQATQVTDKASLTADIKTEQTARTTADEALGKRIDTISASFTTELGKTNAAIVTEAETRAAANVAMSQRVDQVNAALTTETTERKAAITAEQEARATSEGALARRIDTIEAGGIDMTQVNAAIKVESDARIAGDTALGKRIDTVQAQADSNYAAVQQVTQANASLTGKVNASWQLKMEAQSNGQYVAAGIGLGIENGPAGLQSQFLVRADRFAVVAGLNGTTSAPFVVANGQVFINDALINKAFISQAIIGQIIESSAWTNWGQPIMRHWFDIGQMACYHATRPNTYTAMNRDGLQVVVDGVLRVQMGVWG